MKVTLHIQELIGIPIVGTLVATIMQFIKGRLKPPTSQLAVIGLCIVVGTGYVLAANASWFPIVLGALTSASAIWAIVIKPIEDSKP
jgi:hypothetical protein